MKTATVRELRNNFAKLSRWLDAGEKVSITRRGRPYAKLQLEEAAKKTKHVSQMTLKERRAFFRKRFGPDHERWMKETFGDKVMPDSIILTMREEKDW